ncbi:HK97 family phage prohead protease [Microcella pacifica]|uniref:HK97 family phage prohead protease n=1 Tax=Microcella pacifica TaxID=2591847 RepID=A0A9E5MHE0_9MICO|nr:HK97 family phage prohead protease [Microcella pacifica]NHF62240.1 HK97 family phage prohead protease [Microcella pacifica]
MPEYERRAIERPVQLRAAPEGSSSPGILDGYALTFNSLSRDLGGWFEVIDPTAPGEVRDDGMLDLEQHVRVICRTNHDSNLLLGTTDAGSLRLYVDEVGVRYEVDLPDTSYGRDASVLADRGDLRFSSFAFWVLPDGADWEYDAEDRLVRRVKALRLVDVAPVSDPAYWGSSVGLRDFDLDAIRKELRSETPTEPEAAPDVRAAALGRARSIQITIEGSR